MINIKKTVALCAMALVLAAASSNTDFQSRGSDINVDGKMVAMGGHPATC